MTERELRVGAIYDPRRTTWPEGAAWTYHDGWELLLRFAGPSTLEVAGVANGPASLAIMLAGPVAIGLYRFGEGRSDAERAPLLAAIKGILPNASHDPMDAIPWSDVPLEPHLWTRVPPTEEQAPIRIVLIDADTGIVRAMRVALLAPGFTAAMRVAAAAAREAYTTAETFADALSRALRLPSHELAAQAPNVTTLPAKTGETREA